MGYVALAVLLTWPTATHLTTHLPGDGGDDPAIAWNLWWMKYSLLNQPQNPLFSQLMFYPIGINLAFYTLTVLNGLTALPLTLTFGVVAASNLHLWASLALSGYGGFLLTRYLLATEWRIPAASPSAWGGAALAGMVYAFASSKLFYVALGQFNIASTHWIPFAALYFIKIHRQPANWRWPVLSALFLVLQAWTEMTYASFLLVFMALYWLYWLLVDSQRRMARWPYIKSIALLGTLFLLGIAPILAAMLPDMLTEGDFLVVGGGFATAFSADLLGFFVPTMHHPLLGGLVSHTGITNFNKGQHIYLGYTLLALSTIGLWIQRRNRAAWFWGISAVIFALLTLGPEITLNGYNTHLPGPFVVFQHLPFFKGNRYPSRYSVMLLLSLAPLAAIGFQRLAFSHTPRFSPHVSTAKRVLVIILPALFLFEHLSIPLPQSNMTVPHAYQTIAADPADFAVLDIPFAWRNGFRITGAYTTGFMFGQFYQTVHQKPMLQGNTSRNPELKFQYFTAAPVLSSLRILEIGHTLPPGAWQKDRKLAAAVLRFFNIKYIVVRPEPPGYLNTPQATTPYIESVLPVQKLYEDPALVLYRANLPPLPTEVELLNTPLTALYFGEGWGVPGETVAAQRKSARLLVPLNGHAQIFRAAVRLGDASAGATGQMWLELNGWRSAPVQLSPAQHTVSITIPAAAVTAGLNNVWLHFNTLATAASTPPDITIVSAGEEAGNLGHIYLNGVDVSPNQRGYNVALINPNGTLQVAAAFDTHASADASYALTQFIAAAPQDAIIAVAAKDEAGNNLTEEAVAALHSIGGQVDLRGQFRASHALIGGKNAQTILEASDPLQPVRLTTKVGLTEPTVAALFEQIQFSAQP